MIEHKLPAEWFVEGDKLHRYLLDVEHVEGGPKARFLIRFGFAAGHVEPLLTAIFDHPAADNFLRETISPRGDVKYVYEGPLSSPDRPNPNVRTVWKIDAQYRAHFVTLVPMTGGRHQNDRT